MAISELGSLVVDLRLQTAQFIQGVNKTQIQIKRLNNQMSLLGQTFVNVFSGYMVVQGVKGTITMAAEIENLSHMARTGVEDFQALTFATDKYGITAEKLANISKDVSDRLGDFIATGGGEMKDFFEQVAPQIGLTAEALQGLSGPEVLQAVKNAMDAANVSAEEQVFYLETIANDASRLIPLLADGGKEWLALAEKAREFNTVLSQTDLDTLKEFDRQMTTIGKSMHVGFAKMVVGAADQLQWLTDAISTSMRNWGVLFDSMGDTPKSIEATEDKLEGVTRDYRAARKELERVEAEFAELEQRRLDAEKALAGGDPYQAVALGKLNQMVPEANAKLEAQRKVVADLTAEYDRLSDHYKDLQKKLNLESFSEPPDISATKDAISDLVGDVGKLESELATEREALESWYAERVGLLKNMKAQEKQLEAAGVQNVASLHSQLTQKLNDEYKQRDEALKAQLTGAAAIYADYSKSLEVTSEDIANAATGWADEFTDSMTTMVMTGKLSFSDLANSIISDLVRMTIQMQITKPLFDSLSSYMPTSGGTTTAPTGHGGLVAGQGTSGRAVPAAVFASAPRLHTGGYIKSNEVPAILQKGEGVFTPQQMAALGKGVVVNVNNYGQDPVQVQQSGNGQQQIIDIIVGQVNGRINEDIARGQGVAGTLENTYGLRRNAF